MKKNKIATADEAISIIKDGDVMAAAGFVGNGTPEELLIALEKRYLNTGKPNRITLLFSSGLGDAKENRNLLSGCYPSHHQRKDALKIRR